MSTHSPTPEEIQRRLQEFLKQTLQQTPAEPRTENASQASEAPKTKARLFSFHLTPKEVKAHLDRFVIKQDEAKKVLSVAVCDHYHHLRAVHDGEALTHYVKQNVLLVGPTGVGKTYLIKCLAELIGVPMVRADATKFTETGYVGGDVEDLVRELVRQAGGDVELAECGIIYLDEIDKLASSPTMGGRDVSGRGVQTNLLKIMEETEVSLRSQNDIQGQVQAMFDMQRGTPSKKTTISTRHILFIVSGAFDKLGDIIRKRVAQSRMGFGATSPESERSISLLSQVSTRDFIDYGLEPEFVGRLPIRVACAPLKSEDLLNILKHSEGSLLRQYESGFRAYGLKLNVTEEALTYWAELAAEEETGARGLMTIGERTLRAFKFELPGTPVAELTIDRQAVESPEAALEEILRRIPETAFQLPELQLFSDQFRQAHGITLTFTKESSEALIQESQATGSTLQELCQQKFKDFEFGLKLIRTNSGQSVFLITPAVIAQPDKELSNWVVASYKQEPKTMQNS